MASKKRASKGDTWDDVMDDISQIMPIPLFVILIIAGVVGRIFGYI